MDEWRKAARVGLVSEVQVQRVVPEAGEVVAWGTDLSEGGIGLLTNSQLQVGEEIALQIAVPGSDAPISVKGLVVWAKAAKPGLRVGVRFREVEALSGAQILQLVTERLARLSAVSGTAEVALTARQPAVAAPSPSAPSVKSPRLRRPFVTILLAVVALVLFLQNGELRRSVQQLKAQVAALQAKAE